MALPQPALEYLISLSEPSLDALHFSRLARVANLQSEAHEVLNQWVEAAVEAKLCCWVRERRARKEIRLKLKLTSSTVATRRRQASRHHVSHFVALASPRQSHVPATPVQGLWIQFTSGFSFVAARFIQPDTPFARRVRDFQRATARTANGHSLQACSSKRAASSQRCLLADSHGTQLCVTPSPDPDKLVNGRKTLDMRAPPPQHAIRQLSLDVRWLPLTSARPSYRSWSTQA